MGLYSLIISLNSPVSTSSCGRGKGSSQRRRQPVCGQAHLENVQAANQLAIDNDLRKRWPVVELLETFRVG